MNKHDFVFSIAQLREYLAEKGWDLSRVEKAAPWSDHQFNLLIPKYYIDLIDWYDKHDPLKKMVLTSNLEQDVQEYEVVDPIGDVCHSPVPGIVHRYPDRCLLMLTSACAVHCRFCFRKNLLSSSAAHYQKCMEYLKEHTELWEVILSGGDPFTFTDAFMEKVIKDLRSISHIKMIRFHTRTPAVYPARITESFLAAIGQAMPYTIVLHINHPREITAAFIESVKKFRQTGVLVLSQTVLMKDINNDANTLEKLFKGLVEIGVKPYYLHHLDAAAGTHHFRTSVEEGKSIMQKLRGNIPGTCIPEYVIDTPGGYGKIPVFCFQHSKDSLYEATSFEGKKIVYRDTATI
ncbi:lysine-2,3-aminomutase-like protein [soil metagenome]